MTDDTKTWEDRIVKHLKKLRKELRLLRGAIATDCKDGSHSWRMPLHWHKPARRGVVRCRRCGNEIMFLDIDFEKMGELSREYGRASDRDDVEAQVDFDRSLIESMKLFRKKTGISTPVLDRMDEAKEETS